MPLGGANADLKGEQLFRLLRVRVLIEILDKFTLRIVRMANESDDM